MIPMEARRVWFVVANRSQCKLYEGGRSPNSIRLIKEISNPEGRLQDREIDADKPGRVMAEGSPNRGTFDREVSATEKVAERFAKKIGDRLNKAEATNEMDALVLIVESKFLGLIRAALDAQTRACICGEFTKDLIPLPEQECLDHVKDMARELI